MASLLLLRVALVLAVAHLGFGHTKFIRDGGRPSLKIFHHVCALKKDEGPCKAVRDRFYFDIDSGRCERFEYGGCQGNGNNFDTLEECEEMCVVRANKSPCHLEDEPGPCRGLVPRYFFDSKSQECKRFFYGGCFGNANNFKTLKECQATCQRTNADEPRDAPKPSEATKPFTATLIKDDELLVEESHTRLHTQPRRESHADLTPQDFCFLPIVEGECDRSERRFAFNSRTKRCQAFIYSGCGGNRNKFISKKRCMKICMKGRGTQIRIKTKNSNILFRSI